MREAVVVLPPPWTKQGGVTFSRLQGEIKLRESFVLGVVKETSRIQEGIFIVLGEVVSDAA